MTGPLTCVIMRRKSQLYLVLSIYVWSFFVQVMIPLSLFAPHVGEEKQIQERIAKAAPPEQHEIPLHDHLKIPPTTVDRFLQIMALRVNPRDLRVKFKTVM